MILDIRQYISSGIIESYLLGLSSPLENSELEEYARQYPEINKAIADCRDTLERYALMHEVSPPPEMKGRIWEAIGRDNAGQEIPPAEGRGVAALTEQPGHRLGSSSAWKYAAAAAILLLLGSLVLNFFYISRYRYALESYSRLVVSRNDLLVQRQVYQASLARIDRDMQIIHDPSVKPVIMAGVKTHPGMMATVYWNSRSGEVYLAVNNLPPPPGEMQYQLWVIEAGKAVSEGVFNRNEAVIALQKMSPASGAQAFAITLEKKGGSPAPTMSNMYVLGKV